MSENGDEKREWSSCGGSDDVHRCSCRPCFSMRGSGEATERRAGEEERKKEKRSTSSLRPPIDALKTKATFITVVRLEDNDTGHLVRLGDERKRGKKKGERRRAKKRPQKGTTSEWPTARRALCCSPQQSLFAPDAYEKALEQAAAVEEVFCFLGLLHSSPVSAAHTVRTTALQAGTRYALPSAFSMTSPSPSNSSSLNRRGETS
jgi:hypothetical protein